MPTICYKFKQYEIEEMVREAVEKSLLPEQKEKYDIQVQVDTTGKYEDIEFNGMSAVLVDKPNPVAYNPPSKKR